MNANIALIAALIALLLSAFAGAGLSDEQTIEETLKGMGATNIVVTPYSQWWEESQTTKPYPPVNYVARADFGNVNATFYLQGNMSAQQMKEIFEEETSTAIDEAANLEANGFADIKIKLAEQPRDWIFYDFYNHSVHRETIIDAKKYGIRWSNYRYETECCGDTELFIEPLRAQSSKIAVNITNFVEEAKLVKPIADQFGAKLMISQSDAAFGQITYEEVRDIAAANQTIRDDPEFHGYQVALWFEIPYDFIHAGEIPAKIEGIESRTKFEFC